jgi:hypothetical protein
MAKTPAAATTTPSCIYMAMKIDSEFDVSEFFIRSAIDWIEPVSIAS